jgi:pyridoxal 5'-phosphate synthase pdxS subunit
VVEAVRHAKTIHSEIMAAKQMTDEQLASYAKQLRVPVELLKKTADMGRLPVVNFAAGGLGEWRFALNA